MLYDAPDWCHHSGIPRPTVLPPDDELQDALCAIRAAVANAHHDLFDDAAHTTPATSIPGSAAPTARRVDRDRTSAGADGEAPGPATSAGRPGARPHSYSMWQDARL